MNDTSQNIIVKGSQEVLSKLLAARCIARLPRNSRDGNQGFHIGFLHCLWTAKKLYGLSYTPGVLFSLAFGHRHYPKFLNVNAAPLMHRELHRSCKAARPPMMWFYAGRGPPIVTTTSLFTTIGRSQYPFSIVGRP